MTDARTLSKLQTGIPNLDQILGGGIPLGSITVMCGPPGSGKTILAQQICFDVATSDARVLFFSTLSEPTAKTLRYLREFEFFDARKLNDAVHFVDLGDILRGQGLKETLALILQHMNRVKPSIVVIDSFKVFDDLAKSSEELRKFGYELAVTLMAYEASAFLLGEYGVDDIQTNPMFSVVDGLITMVQRESAGENQRFLRIVKLRGTAHSRDEHSFRISTRGIELYAPRLSIHRDVAAAGPEPRCTTGIHKLDEILGTGIPYGSTVLLSGVAGTGKTVLALEFVYQGALRGEKGIFFSFEENEERLRATAQALGWDLGAQIDAGQIELVFIPQPDIMVERHLDMIRERVQALHAKRVVLDSLSVFLHKLKDLEVVRERVFQLCSIIHNAGAVGVFATDIPYGQNVVSRFGVEETVVDGIIVLTSTQEGYERQRYIEVYKMRNTAHLKGRHNLAIEASGIAIYPRYGSAQPGEEPQALLASDRRLSTGVAGLDALIGGGLIERSITVVSGSAGVGKTTLALQFIIAGASAGTPGLYVTFEEGTSQLLASAAAMGMPLAAEVARGKVELVYLPKDAVRAGQFLTVLPERLAALSAKRVVLDAVSHIMPEHMGKDERRQLLYELVNRFKAMGVTTLLTLESASLSSIELGTESGLSPIADNLLLMRYRHDVHGLTPTLTIVKTRGTPHDRGTHPLAFQRGGMSIAGAAVQTKRAPAKKTKRPTTRSRP